jgi:P-type Cu2+ transporter
MTAISLLRSTSPAVTPSLAGIGCCPTENGLPASTLPSGPLAIPNADPSAYVRRLDSGEFELALILENLTCPACVPDIEEKLGVLPALTSVRVNLSLGRLRVTWIDSSFDARAVMQKLSELGYRATPFNAAMLEKITDDQDKALLRAMAVAGFASANIMLISVSIWSGNVTDMSVSTRDFFHWVSALIALPTIAYSGRPFFASAWNAIRMGRVNMDVPISLGVLLAAIASVMESARSGVHAYFDAAVMLLFFLLIGRYLDQNMRARTRSVAANLLALKAVAATVVEPNGARRACPADQLQPGMIVAVAPGDRIPADGIVCRGRSDVDASLVTGESVPQAVGPGAPVHAGTMALTGALEVSVTAADRNTLLGQIVELMANAAYAKSGYTQLADRAARWYAPTVHALAVITFAAWMMLGSGGWHSALMAATAVLIITCPCALGLAVPAVQTVATGALLKQGMLLKSGDGLERMSEVDTVVFDKTGTLTLGRPELITSGNYTAKDLILAARLAQSTRHPLAVALTRAVSVLPPATPVNESPGLGVATVIDGMSVRLGNREWCGVPANAGEQHHVGESELWLKADDCQPVRFGFTDRARADSLAVVAALKARGLAVEMLSGDRLPVASALAAQLGIIVVTAEARPDVKMARLQALAAQGHKVLMVGDGLNDAPSLALAHASMSPASAVDISQTAADVVFRGDGLQPVLTALQVSCMAQKRMRENIVMAVIYNALAVPLAMTGLVTPLIAAIAMSGSSVLVVLNALRLGRARHRRALP